jgi:hypothetical protein
MHTSVEVARGPSGVGTPGVPPARSLLHHTVCPAAPGCACVQVRACALWRKLKAARPSLRCPSYRYARGDEPPRAGNRCALWPLRANAVLLRVVTRGLRACPGLRVHPPCRRARCCSCTPVNARLSCARGRAVRAGPTCVAFAGQHAFALGWQSSASALRDGCLCSVAWAPIGQRYSNRTESASAG